MLKVKYIILILCIYVLASCSSSRRAAKSDIAATPSAWTSGECVTAKANVRLRTDKGKGMTCHGTLRMKRDDVIQLHLTYILGIQIGTMELTRDGVILISRYTRQYIMMSYADLSQAMGRSVTFRDFQDIFWGDAKDFRVRAVEWNYGDYVVLDDNRRLPEEMELSFTGGSTSVKMRFRLNNHKFEDGWNTRTSFNAATYEQMTPEKLRKIMTMLLQSKK